MKQRPLGVTIFSAYFILVGLRFLLYALKPEPGGYPLMQLGAIVGSVFFPSVGIGMLALQAWARWLVLIISGIEFLSGLWSAIDCLIRGNFSGLLFFGLTTVGPSGVILWYFLRPSVKAQFQRVVLADRSRA